MTPKIGGSIEDPKKAHCLRGLSTMCAITGLIRMMAYRSDFLSTADIAKLNKGSIL